MSWTAVIEGSNYFKRSWTPVVPKLPEGKYEFVRGWDLASTKKSEANPNPDWTAGVLIARNKLGHYYVCDSYIRDREFSIYIRLLYNKVLPNKRLD